MDSSSITVMWNISFTDNNAIHEGGAIAFIENQHTDGMLLGETKFRNNRARAGGAIYADAGAVLTVSNESRFEDNYATETGDAALCMMSLQHYDLWGAAAAAATAAAAAVLPQMQHH